jgi:hypothetical protein
MRRGSDRAPIGRRAPGGEIPGRRRSAEAGASGAGSATTATMELTPRSTGAGVFAEATVVPRWSCPHGVGIGPIRFDVVGA